MEKRQIKESRGITLLALVVTIIILLILSGITIATLTGNNGIINNAIKAKEESEIDNEKEIIETSTVQAMGRDKYGDLKYSGFKQKLDFNSNNGIELEEYDGKFFVTFLTSQRIYEVDKNGNVTYLGVEHELKNKAILTASPSSNATPQLVQMVTLTVKTFVVIDDENLSLKYAWSASNEEAPSEYSSATLTGESTKKTASVSSGAVTDEENYYLWAKVEVGTSVITECFGPYAIKDHTTLIYVGTETGSTSSFLGNTNIARNTVESVSLINSFTDSKGVTHSLSDENCWDVSSSQNGKIIAWYTDEDNDTYYEVTIAQKGGVVANADSSYLFSYIGYNGDSTNVIQGIENLDTGLVTNMRYMFYNCSKLTSLDLSNFNTTNVMYMDNMFHSCSSLISINVSGFDTSKVTDMGAMFSGCSGLTSLDLSNFNTTNVIYMQGMFNSCSSLISLDLSNFNTSNVTSMHSMFARCSNLIKLDLSNFNTSNVTHMAWMFINCSKLSELNLSNFVTSKVTNTGQMLQGCFSLTNLNLSKFDPSSLTTYDYMFNGVPTTVQITTNSTMEEWLNTNFSSYTNITIVQ